MFFVSSNISTVSEQYCYSLAAIFIFLVWIYHNNRKDLHFISRYFISPKRNLQITYNLLALPVSAGMIAGHYVIPPLLLHAAVTLIPLLAFKTKAPGLAFTGRYLPSEHFEWISGLRKNFYLLLVLIPLAVFLSPVKFFGTLALFLVNSIFLSFYNVFEPLVMLNPEGLEAEVFLKRKIRFLCNMILGVNIPLLLVNATMHPDIAWFNACFVAGSLLLASCTVYIKYAFYTPNTEMSFHIDFLLLFASVIIPVLLPLTFLLHATYKKKALKHLSNYLD